MSDFTSTMLALILTLVIVGGAVISTLDNDYSGGVKGGEWREK